MKKQFICASTECCSFNRFVAAPYLRKSFETDNDLKNAELTICGLGFYEVYINGTNITKGPLAPYISNPNHLCYYDKYDVSKYLVKGKNTMGIILGNGFYNPFAGSIWNFNKADWINPPCVAFELSINNEVVFEADDTVRVNNSPIIFDELRMGEYYDANREIKNWNMPCFDDSLWSCALKAPTPKGILTECKAEPITVRYKLKPIEIYDTEDGYVYDFGENNSGVCTLRIKAKKGQVIELSHAEMMTNGKFDNYSTIFDREDALFYPEYSQKDKYIASGEGVEEYTPKFTYHGFRYVLVKGITKEQATNELLTYNVMGSDLRTIGGFHCDNETVNTLFDMAIRSDRSNLFYFPTDCPHREKNGWTGDASLSAAHMSMLYDVEKSFMQWLDNIREAQHQDGQIPVIIPTYDWGYDWGSGPAWDTVLFNLPYELWKKRGNVDVIKINANAFMHYFDYILSKKNNDGTVSIGLGDWCPVGKDEHKFDTPIEVTNTIMIMDMARKATEMLKAIEDGNYVVTDKIFKEFRNTIRNVLLDKDTLQVKGNTQTGQAMALYYGVFEKDEKEKAFENLLKYIKEKGNNFDCGCLGMHVLFHVLSDFGQSELAFNMITKDEFPSYKYLIDTGETTFIEMLRNDGERRGSHNHHFFGDIARWFITSISGLNIVDSNTVLIKPNFIKCLNNASAYYELPDGEIRVLWERNDSHITLNVHCDSKIKYNIELPSEYSNVEVTVICK